MRLLSAALLLGMAAPVAAQQPPMITDRPDFTESVAVIAPGRIQLESGYTFTRAGNIEEHDLGELLLRLPLSRRAEARLGVNSYVWQQAPGDRAHGIEDASLGFKLRLTSAAPQPRLRPDVALLGAVSLPTGSDGISAHAWQPASIIALAWTLSDEAGLASNFGYTYATDEGGRFHEVSASLAFGYALTERTGSFVEAFGFAPSGADREATAFFDGGFTYLVSDDLQVDLRGGIGLSRSRPD